MAEYVELKLYVPANSAEEVEKILQASAAGLAAEYIRLGALYGQLPLSSLMTLDTSISQSDLTQPQIPSPQKASEASIQLKTVETKKSKATAGKKKQEKKVEEKPKGLAGRKRMGRV